MYLPTYLTLLSSAEQTLATSYRQVAGGHTGESEVVYPCETFAHRCTERAAALAPLITRYKDQRPAERDRLHPPGLVTARHGPIGLLRDLQDLYQLASLVEVTWTLVGQAATAH